MKLTYFHVAVISDILLNPTNELVSIPGGTATFVCRSPGVKIISLQWLVNESLVENFNLSNVQTEFDNRSGVLIFHDIPVEYNMSRIRCMVFAEGNSEPLLSHQSILILQGESSVIKWLHMYCRCIIQKKHGRPKHIYMMNF